MNKNKLLVKTLSCTLCAAMLMTNVTPTYALTTNEQSTSNVDETRQTEVLYNKSASYFVTIPKIIIPRSPLEGYKYLFSTAREFVLFSPNFDCNFSTCSVMRAI